MRAAVPAMAPDEVHVWLVTVEPGIDLGPCLRVLDDEERARAERLRVDSARRQYVTLHAAAREIIGAYLGRCPGSLRWRRRCHCGSTEHGKPELAGSSGVAFSLSHTTGRGLVAITGLDRIGVDVEAERPGVEWGKLAARFFSAHEASALRGAADRAMLRQWVRREAVGKLVGIGIPPPTLEVPIDGTPAAAGPAVIDVDTGPGAAAAVAVDGPGAAVKTFSWNPTEPVGTQVHGGAQ